MISKVIQMLALSALLAGASAAPQAQQVYRIVGPDGKVTFSDRPPADTNANAKVTSTAGSARGGMSTASLPFELRQVVQRYPVTLYTGNNCSPCQSARSMLITRGVPFAEKSVVTPEDSQALQRLSGENSLPFATIGGQQLKGFSDVEWTQFLNAAGYPASSVLPSSYRQAAATPLVAVSAAPATTDRAAPERAAAPTAQPAPAAASPSGIRF
ncbi:MAG: glutaredoxin family protein [Polaromonas sp.]|jgi:glutaredoxin